LKPENSLILCPFIFSIAGIPPGTVELTLFFKSSKIPLRAVDLSSTILLVLV